MHATVPERSAKWHAFRVLLGGNAGLRLEQGQKLVEFNSSSDRSHLLVNGLTVCLRGQIWQRSTSLHVSLLYVELEGL